MKYALLIVIFCLSKTFSQVGPPSLRCLQVGANGDVTLFWVPPADPGNVFDSYEVYTSSNPTAPFALVANIPGPISTFNYVHSGAAGDIQSKYYYILARSGPSGATFSAHSDTLRTIFLDLNPGTGNQTYLKISYNNLHQPKLPTTSSTFSITKEYPLGSWNTFATTSNITYNDTLSVCSASINYQIKIADNGGACFSSSNFKGDVFNDQKDPDEPAIDSISVLANGDVVLAWKIPPDKDITKYRIYQIQNGGNFIIDTVFGRTNNTYTYAASASSNTQVISIFVSALDSCARISGFTNTGGTMFLTKNYYRCDYRTVLTWTPYKNMPSGLLEYRVYYSPDATNFVPIGTTTATSFVHEKVDGDKNVCYYIRAFNVGRTISSSSNKTCFLTTQVQAPKYLYIRSASVLPDNSVKLKLFVDSGKYAKGLDIYRSYNGISFSQVGFIPTNSSSDYTFDDNKNINPSDSSYYYKSSIKDSCGNTRTVSNIPKTILLRVSEDKEFIFTKHLSWSGYQGFAGGLKDYNIYRVVNGNTPLLIGASGLFSTSFTDNLEDEAAYGSKMEYMVESVEGFDNPFGFRETATSNTKPVYMEGRIFIPAAFAPQGKNKIWKPVTHFIDKQEYKVTVYNRWGNIAFQTSDDTVGWDGDGAPTGIYAYVISYKNSRGEYLELKGTLLML